MAINAKWAHGLNEEILSFCRHIGGTCKITAACANGQYALGLPADTRVVQVLVVVAGFQPRLMNYIKIFDNLNIVVFAVDQWVFERDIDRGFLGEALAGGLIFPYTPLVNGDYLHRQEVKLKERLIIELLQSLILDFPELSYEFYIKPEYFMYESLLTRARLFPLMSYTLMSFMEEDEGRSTKDSFRAFLQALELLEQKGVIAFSNNYVRISKEFIEKTRCSRVRFINLFKTGQRALFTSLLGIFPQVLNTLSQNRDSSVNLQRVFEERAKLGKQIRDPESYVYVSTASGLASLANRMDVEAFARKVLGASEDVEVRIQNLGGILNDVYLVKTSVNHKERKIVAKKFRDWSNFKWFPLTLWSVGTRTFAVLGTSRLERECAINKLLDSKGFAVPRVLYVSPAERLVFMEYVEGEDLRKVIRRVVNSKSSEIEKDLEVVKKVGETLAKVHALDVALGDTKPENTLLGKSGEIYMMDFEQASRNGDKVWDVAEFLYYAGHDVSPLAEISRVERIARAFISGYLKAGGDAKTVKEAANPKYTKVFSVFTVPHIMLALSNECRRADKLGSQAC